MKVRRYFASSMRNALELVRQEQGPEVLILSNRKVDGGVELLTAEGDVDPALIEKFTPKPKAARPVVETEEGAAAVVPPPAAGGAPRIGQREAQLWTNEDTIAQMQRELTSIKSLLEQQLSGLAWTEFGGRNPLRARLLRVLARIGIAPQLGRQLVAGIPEATDYDSGWRALVAALLARLAVADDPVLGGGGHVALCGPTGVGKTSLVSKFAARYALAHGPEQVVLVSTDDQRLGAHQQLKTFGRLLGIAVRAVRSFDELPEQLAQLDGRPLVLIDLPGFPPDDPRFRQSLAALQGLPCAVARFLVLSATTEYMSAARTLAGAAELQLEGCCLTKLDEAAVLGPALSAIMESRLPLAYVSTGPQVPDDLEPAVARPLIQQLLAKAKLSPATAEPACIEQAFAV